MDEIYSNWSEKPACEIEHDLQVSVEKSHVACNLIDARFFETVQSVLEVGCGYGRNLVEVMRYTKAEYGLGCDLSYSAIDYANAHYGTPAVQFFSATTPNIQQTVAEIRKKHDKLFDLVILFDILEHIPKPKEFIRELATISKYFLIKLPIEDTILHNYLLPERMKVYPSAKHPDGHLWEFSVNNVYHFAVRLGLRPESYKFYQYSIKTIYPDHLKPRGGKGGLLYELLRSAHYLHSAILPNRMSLRFLGGGGLVMLATWSPDFVLE